MAATAVVAVCLLVVAGSVAVAGAPSGTVGGTVVGESTHNDSGDPIAGSDALTPQGDSGEIAPELRNATGTVEVIVRFADVPTVRTTDVAGLKQRATSAQSDLVALAAGREDLTVVRQFWLTNAALVAVDTRGLSLGRLAHFRGVERLHPNYEVTIPDPERATVGGQSAASAASSATTYGLDQINVTDAWEAFGTRGENATVAVLDTGVDADHPDIELFTENASDPTYPGGWAEFDENGSRIDSQPYDAGEHGTHVSGTVAGGNASGEYIGVAPEATLLHAAVLTDCSGQCSGTFSQIVAGMQWAVEQDADAISMSLGGWPSGAEYIEPIRNAQNAGTIVVAATGNRGAGATGSPGDIYDVTSVGASNEGEGIWESSNGAEINTSDRWGQHAPDEWPETYLVPDVAAPGVQVKSAIPGGGYDRKNGTSMATPHVSGVVALMVSNNSDVGPNVLARGLAGSAWKPGGAPEEKDIRYGHGIVDAYHAINLVAFDSGIVGTVTSQGSPLANATVETDWRRVTTDGDGNFELLAPPGTHGVTVSKFGYDTTSRQVTVTEGQDTEVDIDTTPVVDLGVVEDQPEGIEDGEAVTLTLAAAHLDELTLELQDGFEENNATLIVDGRAASFGDGVSFEHYSGTVPVTVETHENATGELGLSITGAGPGADATLSTGTTRVFEERVDVGILGLDTSITSDLESTLAEQLPAVYTFNVVENRPDVDEYDIFVVNDLGVLSFSDTQEFVDDTGTDEVGVVYLSQYRTRTIRRYAQVTGTPDETFQGNGDTPITYRVTGNHPVLGGRLVGDRIQIHDDELGDHTWFENASGEVVAAVVANGSRKGPALAVDDANNTVLGASLGYHSFSMDEAYTAEADAILGNAVKYVTPDRFDVETLELGFSPSEVEVGIDQRREIEVFARGLDAPISAYDLTIEAENDEALEIVDVRLAGNPSLSEVEIEGNGSRTHLTAVIGDENEVTPRFPIATITVQGVAEGTGELVFTDVDVRKPDGTPHKIKETDTGVVIISEDAQPPPVVGDDPPQDLDGDGLYEDIDGDGSFTVGDVQALFDSLSPIRRQQNPQLFNFDRKEPPEVTVSDVQALFQLLQDQG